MSARPSAKRTDSKSPTKTYWGPNKSDNSKITKQPTPRNVLTETNRNTFLGTYKTAMRGHDGVMNRCFGGLVKGEGSTLTSGLMPHDLRCDGNVSGRDGADLLYLLDFLQNQFLSDGILLLLLILREEQDRKTENDRQVKFTFNGKHQQINIVTSQEPILLVPSSRKALNPTTGWKLHYLELLTRANISQIKGALTDSLMKLIKAVSEWR